MRHALLKRYRQLTADGSFYADPAQQAAANALADVAQALQRRNPGLLGRLRRGPREDTPGLYLWGGVGRGKTWLMDLFFDTLPSTRKQRIHFHRFMQRIHHDLRGLGEVRNPLDAVARRWSREVDVLCLDEFFVSDIADAMLLAGLLQGLFERGVTLVTTSNVPPDDLYRNGLQRRKFLPAIDLLKRHARVMELPGDTDYRLRILERSDIFYCPNDAASESRMEDSFSRMAAECEMNTVLQINGRPFRAHRRGDGVIWFGFDEVCVKPRGTADYVEIAYAFNTVFLSDIPQLGDDDADAARRFIALVDEFYDRNVKLLASAAVPADRLYQGRRLAFEFQRTASRLIEMQSHQYLARPHLP